MKSFMFYIGMLGGLVIAMTAIMAAGRNLTPPHALGGGWALNQEAIQQLQDACGGLKIKSGGPDLLSYSPVHASPSSWRPKRPHSSRAC